jgi:hypothetical protein
MIFVMSSPEYVFCQYVIPCANGRKSSLYFYIIFDGRARPIIIQGYISVFLKKGVWNLKKKKSELEIEIEK